jgi:hypothetical protein
MLVLTLSAYTAPTGARRTIAVVAPAARLEAAGRPAAARVAAALERDGGLLIDRGVGSEVPRLVATLAPGEGLAVARAVVADYLPRARRASVPLARALEPADLEPVVSEELAA